MPVPNTHVIRRQSLQVELQGTEADGLLLQRRLPDLCQQWLTPAIERVLDNCAPAQGHLFIERLEIDAGTIKFEDFEHGFPAAVAQALEKQLGKQLLPTESSAWHSSSGMQHKTEPQSVYEAFIHFLRTGALPWWFRPPADKSFEQIILDSWLEASQTVAAPRHFGSGILDVLTSTTVQVRLVQQFSPVFLEKLFAAISPEGLKNVAEVVWALDDSELTGTELAIFLRQLWHTAFARLAEGKTQTTLALAAAIRHPLQQRGLQVPALTLLLKRLSAESSSGSAANIDEPTMRDVSPPEKLWRNSKSDSKTVRSVTNDTNRTVQDTPTNTSESILRNLSPFEKPQENSKSISATVQSTANDADQANQNSFKRPSPELGSSSSVNSDEPTLQGITPIGKPQRDDSSKSATLRPATINADRTVQDAPARAAKAAHIDPKESLYINCAGVILLHPFLPRFFEALGIAAEGKLLQPERALCLLHFLATGQSVAPEYDLLLPKLFCNVPFEHPVEADVALTAAELEEAAALLDAVVRHWDALGNTSADSLRGTFLVRPGKLSPRDDGDWLLQVETRSFDILLDQLPWGFRMIKLPWMEKMLWVEWR